MALGAHNNLRMLLPTILLSMAAVEEGVEAVKAEAATCRDGTGLPPPPGFATKPGTPL
jgi:hypothetical protein